MRPDYGETRVRRPAAAGLFYPSDPAELRANVSEHLRQAAAVSERPAPKALIVPHAGYVYSGEIAAQGYACIQARSDRIRRVVLIGPSHRVFLRGAAVPRVAEFDTPLGRVPIDAELRARLIERGDVLQSDQPHLMEHSLEVQLPFLQVQLGEFTVLPVVLGDASADYVAALLEAVWGGEETLVLVSSDLSHYHDYESAQRIDAATSRSILRLQPDLTGDQACGAVGINGLLEVARSHSFTVTQIARCNSGDTAGDRRRVVGYGAFGLHEAAVHA